MRVLKKESIGKSRGGNTTKIHAVVDALGNPIKIELSAGQVSDHIFAPKLIEGLNPQIVMADGGYDSLKLRQQIEKQGAIACIPRHRNRKIKFPFDKEQYKKRNVVERFFQRLKENHRLAMRFDKRADRFFSFVLFASILLWLK